MPTRETTSTQTMIIAIDGPAAAGKSTVAKLVARELSLTFLDTGAMYRAVTMVALHRGIAVDDEEGCARVARSIRLEFDAEGRIWIDGRLGEPTIRGDDVTRAVSPVSALSAVRAAIVPLQRIEAERRGGIVAEGRDIGSVVFPRADFKFYLDASAEVRARRRVNEMGEPERYHEILEKIRARDHADMTRKDSPLTKDPGAVVVDTDALDARGVAAAMLQRIRGRSASR